MSKEMTDPKLSAAPRMEDVIAAQAKRIVELEQEVDGLEAGRVTVLEHYNRLFTERNAALQRAEQAEAKLAVVEKLWLEEKALHARIKEALPPKVAKRILRYWDRVEDHAPFDEFCQALRAYVDAIKGVKP